MLGEAQGPFHQRFCHRNLKSMGIPFGLPPNYNTVVATQCLHVTAALARRVQKCSYQTTINEITVKKFHRIWIMGEKVSAKWTPVILSSVTWSDSNTPDSKVHGANTGPIWGRQDPGGPHVGPMNLAIWDLYIIERRTFPRQPRLHEITTKIYKAMSATTHGDTPRNVILNLIFFRFMSTQSK